MSKEALAKVVQRAISDAAFRRQLSSDPAGALRGFDLTADETSAIRTGDAGRLSTLGVDQRMSKSFALGGMAASTRMSASDLTPGGGPSMVDDLSGAGGRTVIPADPAQRGSAIATGSEANRSADIDGGNAARTVRAGDDYKFAGRQAPDSSGT
ncbi:MAG: Os1348 family NHLP clan protein, partial [Chloroflexota bacterium]